MYDGTMYKYGSSETRKDNVRKLKKSGGKKTE